MSKTAIVLISIALALSLRSTAPVHPDQGLDALLWMQTSAEHRGLCRQAYNAAAKLLDESLADPFFLAALEQAADVAAATKRPAIIVDIDETVLDNAPYQARLILDGSSYDDASWDLWVKEAKAAPLPGALAFLSKAAARGVRIFYVTNRKAHLEEATRANLQAFGFPLAEDLDCVLMRGEKEGWDKDKGSRRALIARDHRIIMLFGDDLGDFISSARGSLATRAAMVDELGERFGRSWFLIPNPTYGSWKDALSAFRTDLEPAKVDELRRRQLDARRD